MNDKTKTAPTSDRKQDHIDLAFRADMANKGPDDRFFYEPALSGHPPAELDISIRFVGKTLKAPIWVSSMTGGTERAMTINQRLAKACAKFGLGMGLGSCRPLLDNLKRLDDFNVREFIGPNLPLFANLGIAQLEEILEHGRIEEVRNLINTLEADGLIVHVNPLQEWLQPEGDFILHPPVDTISRLVDKVNFPVIVKEVGQGMGPESIAALLQLPIAALELAAHGGTNFAKLELLRSSTHEMEIFDSMTRLGHSMEEMVFWINGFGAEEENVKNMKCQQFILSGGVRDFLDGYYWMSRLNYPAVYGQASGFLRYAAESQEALDAYLENQIRGLQLAQAFLKVK